MVKLRPSEGFAVEPRTFLVIQAAPIDYSRPVVECTCASVNQAAGLQGGRRRSEGGERLGWREWETGRAVSRCYSFLSGKEL